MHEVLSEYEGPLTADFQREYGLRLEDAVIDRDYQEILDLITWLPVGCAYHACVRSGGNTEQAFRLFGWKTQDELLLHVTNLLSQNTYVTAQVQSSKKLKPPKPTPSPHDASTRPKSGDANAIARALLAQQ